MKMSSEKEKSFDPDVSTFYHSFGKCPPPISTYHIPWMKFSSNQRPIVLENGLEPFFGYYKDDRVCFSDIVRQSESKNKRKIKKKNQGKLNLLTEGLREIGDGLNDEKSDENDCDDFLDPSGYLAQSGDDSEEEIKVSSPESNKLLANHDTLKTGCTNNKEKTSSIEGERPTGNFSRLKLLELSEKGKNLLGNDKAYHFTLIFHLIKQEHVFFSYLIGKYGYHTDESVVENLTDYRIFKEMMKLTQWERNAFQEMAEKIYPKYERALTKSVLKHAFLENRKLLGRIKILPARHFQPIQELNQRNLVLCHPNNSNSESEFELIHERMLLEAGTFIDCPKISKHQKIFRLSNSREERENNFPELKELGVAFDESCEMIVNALHEKPDIVISSSALKQLFSNFCEAWTIPFELRKYGTKKIVFFCKSLPAGHIKPSIKERNFYKKSFTARCTDNQHSSNLTRVIQPANSLFDDGSFDISELETFGSTSKPTARFSQYDGGCDSNSDDECTTSTGRRLRGRIVKSPRILQQKSQLGKKIADCKKDEKSTAISSESRSQGAKRRLNVLEGKDNLKKRITRSTLIATAQSQQSTDGCETFLEVPHVSDTSDKFQTIEPVPSEQQESASDKTHIMYDDLRESDSDEECELKIVLTESSSLDPMEEKVDLNVPSAIGAIKDEAIEKAPAFHRENDKEADQGLTSEKQQSPSEHHEERLSHNIHSNALDSPKSEEIPMTSSNQKGLRRAYHAYMNKTLFRKNKERFQLLKKDVQKNQKQPLSNEAEVGNSPFIFGPNIETQVFNLNPLISHLPIPKPNQSKNVSYNLWNLSKKGDSNSEKIKLLIRNKCHAVRRASNQRVIFSVKLEHQAELGAEEMTRQELADEWISTLTRPDSVLLRHRIDVHTGKVVHTEERDLDKIVRDDPREKFRPNSLLSNLNHIFKLILDSNLDPGMYLIKNSENCTTLPKFYKEAALHSHPDILDVLSIFPHEDLKNDCEFVRRPWIPLDHRVVLTDFPAPCLFKSNQFKKKSLSPNQVEKNSETNEISPKREKFKKFKSKKSKKFFTNNFS